MEGLNGWIAGLYTAVGLVGIGSSSITCCEVALLVFPIINLYPALLFPFSLSHHYSRSELLMSCPQIEHILSQELLH